MTDKLREQITEIVDYCSESYYPEHEYGDSHRDSNLKYLEYAVEQIIKAFEEEGWLPKAEVDS